MGVQQIDAWRADQLGNKSGGRAIINILGGTDLDDAPLIEHPDAVSHGEGFDLVVGDKDRGRSQCFLQVLQLHTQRLTQLGIQVGERFVHQEDARLAHDGATDRDTLHLAARQVGGFSLQQVVDAQDIGCLVDLLFDLIFREAVHWGAQREGQVVVYRHVGIERVLLEDKGHIPAGGRPVVDGFFVEVQRALVLFLQPGNDAQGGGFSGSGWAEQDEELAFLDGKRYFLEGGDPGKTLGNAF